MNSKNIKRHLGNKLRDWMESIEDENVKAVVKENTIITGGALVSLLTGEPVHDYDVYFRTRMRVLQLRNTMLISGTICIKINQSLLCGEKNWQKRLVVIMVR